ncbi:unnamed protein product [Rhizoctonia solani]|uniref:BTB domain-containing protein n=1 Tax=Rhizoctonia solani TaxID=456999 RepID=A0A8H3BC57_9AGAM|nr:unnamed protein product [Rhizoctonia solani]
MTAMSTYDSSSSPASSIADAGWQTPSKNERETTEGNDNPISEEENTKQDTIPESDPSPPKSHTTSAFGGAPTCDPAFNFSDTNIQIKVENRLFRIHQFKLNEFDRLRPKLEQATKDDKERKTIEFQDSADDFHRLLVVLYSSAYDFHLFGAATLKSTLKLAAKYGHPTLRTFAIKELEKHELEPIDRFALSRDCGVTEWMSKAIDDLCWREDPMTIAEARILGPEKFVEVASRREGVKFERGSRVNIDGGPPKLVIEAKPEPEPAVSCRPVSHDLDGILAASSDLLTTTSKAVLVASEKHSPTVAPASTIVPAVPSSDRILSDSPLNSQSTVFTPLFSGFAFDYSSFNARTKAPGPKASSSTVSSSRVIKEPRTNKKGQAQ